MSFCVCMLSGVIVERRGELGSREHMFVSYHMSFTSPVDQPHHPGPRGVSFRA